MPSSTAATVTVVAIIAALCYLVSIGAIAGGDVFTLLATLLGGAGVHVATRNQPPSK